MLKTMIIFKVYTLNNILLASVTLQYLKYKSKIDNTILSLALLQLL